MTAEEFISKYESALATQKWQNVAPLVSKSASVTFSNGAVHTGISQIKSAFEHNFNLREELLEEQKR